MGRIDRSQRQSCVNYSINQLQLQPAAAPNPPQPPQGYHPHDLYQQQATTHVSHSPHTIGFVPPPQPYEPTYHTANVNQQNDTLENVPQQPSLMIMNPTDQPPQPVPFPPPSPQMATARSFLQVTDSPQAQININQSSINYNNQPQFHRQVTDAGSDMIENVPRPPPPYDQSTYNMIDDNQHDKQQFHHHHQPNLIHPTQVAQPVPFTPHMGRAQTFPQATDLPHHALSGGVISMGFPPASPTITTGAPRDISVTNSNYTIVTPITNEWRTGLFDCMLDPEIAIRTACFPCATFGQIAEIVDKGDTPCGTSGQLYVLAASTAMPWLLSSMYRGKLRKRYGIKESPASDWAVHFFCEFCALCQEYRELKCRGIDPSVGWHGNMENNDQSRQVTMTPPMIQTMMG